MNIKERSKAYADGKVLDALSAVIEQAYADGFNDGMNYSQLQKQEAIENGVEYIDLALSSGTMWSSTLVNNSHLLQNRLSYIEASKLNIPTKEQFVELCKECFATNYLSKSVHGIKFTGKNGNFILIQFVKINDIDNPQQLPGSRFWLKDREDSDMALCAKVDGITNNNKVMSNCKPVFIGLHLPVMLVK